MNRFAILLAATAAAAGLVAFAAPASAQERATFTGPRAEVTVGYDTTSVGDDTAGAPDSVDQARIGGVIGYDVALGDHWTIGGEVGIGGTLGDGRRFDLGATRYEIDQGRDIDASLRLGYKLGDRTLVYGKAGWANSRFIGRVDTGAAEFTEASNEDGVRLGAGVEHMLTDHIYAKAEYRFTSYGDDVERHQLLAGVGFRF